MENKVIHGDCLVEMKSIPDKSIDMVVTDPPYKLTQGGRTKWLGVDNKNFLGYSDYKNDGELFKTPDFDEWLPHVYRKLKNDADFYVMTNDKNMRRMMNSCHEAGFKLHNIITWAKNNKVPNRWYFKQCEYILYFWKGKAKTINQPSTSNLISINNPTNKKHPTEKPTSLIEILIKNSSDEGDLILDPFAGSGTTGEACENLGRNYILIEKEKEYIDVINKRLSEMQKVLFI